MILSHKIALDPTDAQRAYFAKAAGCARFVWNLALDEWNRLHETGECCDWMDIQKEFNAFKYFAFPWMKEIHRDAHARPFRNLGKAFIGFFKKTCGRPKFHKKGCRDRLRALPTSTTAGCLEKRTTPMVGSYGIPERETVRS